MPQELKPSVIGVNELSLQTAIANTKIKNSTQQELIEVLRLVFVKVGIRAANLPSGEEVFVLVEHILKNYGNHTCEEIKLAFDMAIAGQIEAEVNHYENFSCVYFSNIMNGYRRWAREAYKQIPETQPPQQKLLEQNKITTDAEMYDWIGDWIMIRIIGLNNPTLVPSNFYEFMDKKGIIQLTKEERWEIITVQAVAVRHYNLTKLIQSEGEHSESARELELFNEMKILGCFKGHEVTRLREIAKKIAVFDYLNQTHNEVLHNLQNPATS